MYRTALIWLCLLLALVGTVTAGTKESAAKKAGAKKAAVKESAAKEPAAKESAAKELSGMSVIGNDEAPKALYIVPWKSSEMGIETSMNMMLNENATPVDRDVFMRQLDFYEVSTKK